MIYMLGRRLLSPEVLSARFSTVRTRHPRPRIRLPMLTLLALLAWPILGALIVLFLQCMTALFNPVHRRREGIKWGPVSYTVIMFLSATVFTAVNLNIQSISFIDNREYRLVFTTAVDSNELPGPPSMLLGPLGYQWSILTDALSVTLHLMFLLNYWLANGLLVGSPPDAAFTHPCT